MPAPPHPLLARLIGAARRSASSAPTSASAVITPRRGETSADWARVERALKRQEIAEEAAHVGTFEADLETGDITISREVARLHDWDPEHLVLPGPQFLGSIHPEDRETLLGLAGRRDDFTHDYRFLRPGGTSSRIFEISGRWLPGEQPGHPGYFIGVERDVTEQRAQEAQLRRLALHDSLTGTLNRRGFEDLLTRYAAAHAVPESGFLLMIDLDDFKHHNDTYGHAVGDAILVAIASAVSQRLEESDALGRIGGDEFVVLLPGRDTAAALTVADELLVAIAGAADHVSPDPEHPVTASIGIAPFTDDDDPTLVLRRADEAMYAAKSAGGGRSARWRRHPLPAERRDETVPAAPTAPVVDARSGLPGRRGLLAQAERRLADGAGMTPGTAAYVVDIVGLEVVERDTAAEARASLLHAIARRFAAHSDGEAVVGLLGECRVAALVPCTDETQLKALTDALRRAFEGPHVSRAGAEPGVSLLPVVGVATWRPGTDAYTLLQDATIAANAAGAGGPGTVRRYDPALREWASQRVDAHVALQRGLAHREFRLLFQPGLDLATGRFTRAEALVRWHPSSGGVVSPNEFIPIAEASGLIIPLGEQVRDLAIAQARIWQHQHPEVRISVNISAAELCTPAFAERMIARIAEAGLGPEQFTFEVTESALMQNLALGRAALQELADAGHRVLIDDFGSGYSSLARLSEIPTQGIKIDMGLVQQLATCPAARTVLSAIVDVGGAYDLAVTAEGIEDATTLQIVRDLGVDYAQGYYLSRPKPPEELAELLATTWADSALRTG